MAVRINFNICDNSSECSGIAVCDTGALFWNENGINHLGDKGILSVDNSRCVSCGKCVGEDGCPVGAIVYAPTEKELEALTESLHIDKEQIQRLFVERYGAEPVDETICISASKLDSVVMRQSGITIVEYYADWSIQCLLNSIPIDSIMRRIEMLCGERNISYYKVDVTEATDKKQVLPALHIYRDGEIIATLEGYYAQQRAEEFLVKIAAML